MTSSSTVEVAGEEGAARLVSRVDVNGFATGTLQVFQKGAWGAVCTSNFDDQDATVACRQLGFSVGLHRPDDPKHMPDNASPEQVHPSVVLVLDSGTKSMQAPC